MIVHEPEIRIENGEVLLSARVETNNRSASMPETLWYAYPERYGGFISQRADPFLAALLLVAQTLGENLQLRGETSPRLLYGMNEYQQLFHYWDPAAFKRIDICADKTSHAPPSLVKDQFVSLFSGGVDSFFTLYQALLPEPGAATWPLTHGLFMQGSPDISLVYVDKYRILSEQYARMYAELGLELITARTNLMHFSAHRIPFVSFLEAPTASCALALSPMLSGLLTPAGETYRRYSLITTGPMTPQHFTTESFESKESGATFLRLQKVEMISQWEPVQKHLRVCFGFASKEKTTNCSRCSKCMRTRLDLHILGKLDTMGTFDREFSFLDYLRWGRWLEIGHGWEKNAWNYCRKHRPGLIPMLLVGIVTGYIRAYLKHCLPHGIRQWIFKFTGGDDPHIKHEAGQPIVRKAEIEVQES